MIRKIKRVSRPGLRIYKGSSELMPQLAGRVPILLFSFNEPQSINQTRQKNFPTYSLCLHSASDKSPFESRNNKQTLPS